MSQVNFVQHIAEVLIKRPAAPSIQERVTQLLAEIEFSPMYTMQVDQLMIEIEWTKTTVGGANVYGPEIQVI